MMFCGVRTACREETGVGVRNRPKTAPNKRKQNKNYLNNKYLSTRILYLIELSTFELLFFK